MLETFGSMFAADLPNRIIIRIFEHLKFDFTDMFVFSGTSYHIIDIIFLISYGYNKYTLFERHLKFRTFIP